MDKVCSTNGEKTNRILVGNPEGKRRLEKPRRRCDNIKSDLREVGCGDMNWTDLAQVRD
jgi:hypothetical protein